MGTLINIDSNNNRTIVQMGETTRKAPWIGCGVTGAWTDYRDAMVAGGLDFYVIGQDAYTNHANMWGTQQPVHVPGIQVNMKAGSDEVMGVVSDNYGIVQNEDAFSMLEPFTQAGGVIRAAGQTAQGLQFMVMTLEQTNILGDNYDVDIMATNSFNGAFPCAIIMVPTRIVCQNMYRKLLGSSDNVMRFRHGSRVEERMSMMKHAASNVIAYMDAFKLQLENAYNYKLGKYDIETLIGLLFPYPKPGGKYENTSREKVDALREDFHAKYYLAEDNTNFLGTGMGFINAYYDYLSHREPTKNMQGAWADRRLSGLVSGNDIKPFVLKSCML